MARMIKESLEARRAREALAEAEAERARAELEMEKIKLDNALRLEMAKAMGALLGGSRKSDEAKAEFKKELFKQSRARSGKW